MGQMDPTRHPSNPCKKYCHGLGGSGLGGLGGFDDPCTGLNAIALFSNSPDLVMFNFLYCVISVCFTLYHAFHSLSGLQTFYYHQCMPNLITWMNVVNLL